MDREAALVVAFPISAAIIKTKSIGGNILKVVFHKAPHGYKAHSIKADIYRTNNPDSVIINKPANHPDHASIWLYRYNFGMDIEYKVFINDDFVYMSSAGTITKVDVYTPGNYTVWAKTEKKVILPNPLVFLVSDFAREFFMLCSHLYNPLDFPSSQMASISARDICLRSRPRAMVCSSR